MDFTAPKAPFNLAKLLLIPCLFWMSGCWNAPNQVLEERLTQAQAKLHAVRELSSMQDPVTAELVEGVERRLREVRRLITEAEYGAANRLLDEVTIKLDRHLKLDQASEQESGPLSVFGKADYRPLGGGPWKPLAGGTDLGRVESLRTGFRSQVRLITSNESKLILTAESELTLLSWAGRGDSYKLILKQGGLHIDVRKEDKISIECDALNGEFKGDAVAELALKQFTGSGYFALYEGAFSWSFGRERSLLGAHEAISWKGENQEVIQLPTAPRIESPTPHETVNVADNGKVEILFRWYTQLENSGFQLQISEKPTFVTRLVDREPITDSQMPITLKPGEYSWRVRAFSQDSRSSRIPGPFTRHMTLYVSDSGLQSERKQVDAAETAKVKGPNIYKVEIQPFGSSVIVKGRTEPAMRVKINGMSAFVSDDGSFQAVIESRKGSQIMRVEVTNPRNGARTVEERQVTL